MKFPERSLEVLHFMEPSLEFAYRQITAHPKDGLFLYGPHDKPKKTKEIRIGVVGTNDGIAFFRKWATQIKKRVEVPPPGKTEKKDRYSNANPNSERNNTCARGILEYGGISNPPHTRSCNRGMEHRNRALLQDAAHAAVEALRSATGCLLYRPGV